jgi:dihydrofolate reductase
MPYADKIDITRVHQEFEADAYFPEIDPKEWQLILSEFNEKDEKHLYDYTFQTLIRK